MTHFERKPIIENTKEYLMPRNEGIKDTQEEANVLFEDGMFHLAWGK